MKITLKLFIALVFLLTKQVLATPHVNTYGSLPFVSDMKISPSGKKIAYFQDKEGQYVLVHKNLEGNSKQKAFGVTEGHIRSFMWISDDRIALTMSVPIYIPGEYEQFTVWRVKLLDLNTSKIIDPFDSVTYKFNIGASKIVSILPKDPEHILMANYVTYNIVGALYRSSETLFFKVNILNGNAEKLDNKDENIVSKSGSILRLVNSTGDTVLYRTFSKEFDKVISLYKSKHETEYKPLMIKTKEGEEVFLPFINGFDATETYVYFIKKNKHNLKTGYRAEIIDGYVVNIKVVAQRKEIDLNHFVENELSSNVITGGHFTDDHSFTDYFDKNLAQVQADLVATFPNSSVAITSYDINKQKFVIEISGALYGVEYYLYDTKAGAISRLANAYPNHKTNPKSNVRRYDFVASDGTDLRGYLTLPKTKKLPPLIVLPHGGPAQRDSLAFDWMRQFFAANGFAVLQVNFRGSSGFGEDFEHLGHGQWGKKMQTDLDDGVAALIADNLIERGEICIVGASYGGYAALIGATKKPELYKCAVSYAGVSYLEDMFSHAKEQGGSDTYWIKSIGDRFDTLELKRNSPASLANEKTSAILLLHGDKDTVVPERQSRRMYKALNKINHKRNKFMVLEGADHWFSESRSRKIFLEESYKFISKHLGG